MPSGKGYTYNKRVGVALYHILGFNYSIKVL